MEYVLDENSVVSGNSCYVDMTGHGHCEIPAATERASGFLHANCFVLESNALQGNLACEIRNRDELWEPIGILIVLIVGYTEDDRFSIYILAGLLGSISQSAESPHFFNQRGLLRAIPAVFAHPPRAFRCFRGLRIRAGHIAVFYRMALVGIRRLFLVQMVSHGALQTTVN